MDTTRERVLQCIIDLFNARRPAHRVLIAQHMGVKLSTVDDAVKRLKEDMLVRTTTPGYVEPIEQHPPSRPLSITKLPNGQCKVEVGDDLLTLTPHEAQMLGIMLHGDAQTLMYWHEERQTGAHIVQLQGEVRAMKKELRDTRRLHFKRGPHGQPDLFVETEAPRRSRKN